MIETGSKDMEKVIRVTCRGAACIPVEDLEAFQGDLKTLGRDQAGKIRESIQRYGFSFPVFVWEDNRGKKKIIDGHQRLFILRKMLADGWALEGGAVPVAWIDAKDEHEAKKKILLAASVYARVSEGGIKRFLEEADITLDEIKVFVDIPNIDIEQITLELGDDEGEEDAVPSFPRHPVTGRGDLWKLGDHLLLCGDSTSVEDVGRVVGPEEASAVFTDPPYNIAYEGKTKDRMTIENDALASEEFSAFLSASFTRMIEVTRPGGAIYVCHAESEGLKFRAEMVKAGWDLKQCLIWVKNAFVVGRQDYQWRHEPILYGWKPGAAHTWYGGRNQDTIWEYNRPVRNAEHPTMKPVQLVAQALKNSTVPGDVVFDPFGGSGSTLIACSKLGRRCRMIELDPRYCDVIVARWEKYARRKAKRAGKA